MFCILSSAEAKNNLNIQMNKWVNVSFNEQMSKCVNQGLMNKWATVSMNKGMDWMIF